MATNSKLMPMKFEMGIAADAQRAVAAYYGENGYATPALIGAHLAQMITVHLGELISKMDEDERAREAERVRLVERLTALGLDKSVIVVEYK